MDSNDDFLEINEIVNAVGITRKVKRALLRLKFGLDKDTLDELLPMEREWEDY